MSKRRKVNKLIIMKNVKLNYYYLISQNVSLMMTLSILILLLQYWMMKTVHADELADYQQAIIDKQNAVTENERAYSVMGVFFGIVVIIWICIHIHIPDVE
jgi:Ca2+/Na+ antiporter